MKKTIIIAGAVLTMDDQYRLHTPGYVIVGEGKILEVGGGCPPDQEDGVETVDLSGHLVMPGLINCHTHSPMVLTRGMCEGVSLFTMDGFINTLRRYESYEDAEMASASTGVSCAEMIRTGTTCFADQYFYADKIFREVDAAGLRAVIAYGIVELGDEARRAQELANADAFLKLCAGHPRITGWIGPHAFFVDNSLEIIREEISLAKKNKAGFHIHFATSNEENDYCEKVFGCSAVEKMAEMGIMEIPVLAAHSITVSDSDMDIMAKHPFYPVIAPSAAMRSGFPSAPVKTMLEKGVTVALGTDNVCNSNTYDLFSEMGTAGKLIIHREQDVKAVTPKQIVSMATREGAKALGKWNEIGSLEPGKFADLIALDMEDIGWAPFAGQDYYTQLVYSVSGYSVTHSMAGGQWLMKNRTLLTINYPDYVRRMEADVRELLARMGN
jgi:5-methylthioadenosine/S-adenosylhomocysteine deaminase